MALSDKLAENAAEASALEADVASLGEENAALQVRVAELEAHDAGHHLPPPPPPPPAPTLATSQVPNTRSLVIDPSGLTGEWRAIRGAGDDITAPQGDEWVSDPLAADATWQLDNLRTDGPVTVGLLVGEARYTKTVQLIPPVVTPPPPPPPTPSGSLLSKLGFSGHAETGHSWEDGTNQQSAEAIIGKSFPFSYIWAAEELGIDFYIGRLNHWNAVLSTGGKLAGKRPVLMLPLGFNRITMANLAAGQQDADWHRFWQHSKAINFERHRPIYSFARESGIDVNFDWHYADGSAARMDRHRNAANRWGKIFGQYYPTGDLAWSQHPNNGLDNRRAFPDQVPQITHAVTDWYGGNGGAKRDNPAMYDTWLDEVRGVLTSFMGHADLWIRPPDVGTAAWQIETAISGGFGGRPLKFGFNEWGFEASSHDAACSRVYSGDSAVQMSVILDQLRRPECTYGCAFLTYATCQHNTHFKDHDFVHRHGSGQFDAAYAELQRQIAAG